MTTPINSVPSEPTDHWAARDAEQNARDASLYREMVAQSDVSAHDRNTEQRHYLGQAVSREMTAAFGQYGDAGLTASASDAVINLRSIVDDRVSMSNRAANEARKALLNDRVPMPARISDANKIIADNAQALREQEVAFDAIYANAERSLMDAARPVVSTGEETTARADARMLLDGAAKPFDIQTRITEYVRNHDDSVAGLLADEKWLSTYLTGRGMADSLSDVMPGIRAAIASASQGSSNAGRKAAANRLSVLNHYRAAFDGASGMHRFIDPRGKSR